MLKKKEDIIVEYEIELSQVLLKAGFKMKGLITTKYNSVVDKNALNIIHAGFPFLEIF